MKKQVLRKYAVGWDDPLEYPGRERQRKREETVENRDLRRSLLAGDRDTRFKAALRLWGLLIYGLNRNQSVCANLLHRFLHSEFI